MLLIEKAHPFMAIESMDRVVDHLTAVPKSYYPAYYGLMKQIEKWA